MVQTPKELPDLNFNLPPTPNTQQISENKPTPAKIPEQAYAPPPPKKTLTLPRIEHPRPQIKPPEPKIDPFASHDADLKQFEEAINNIDINIIHDDAKEDTESKYSEPAHEEEHHTPEEKKSQDYYKPTQANEGYFSEIEHYLKNKDMNEIIDDVMKKDFLTSMKDYHDTKVEGKPFYLHKKDLEEKLQRKMQQLKGLEEQWHKCKSSMEETNKHKQNTEKEIDKESQEIKELFRQLKINQLLEQQAPKEQYFKLRNGQELKNLNDLRKNISYMQDADFEHHVNEEKNDFAMWVNEALENPEIYEKIKDIKNKKELEEALKNLFLE
ncbi:MAG: hypothetical protein KKF46_03435 [Nanoarchaeota archaeon]|nr:hypothetical protein [Nanoarchaeota archaeon]MBU1321387.1 hypothetical protein [Nanoarchaeota archaeon]MBU1597447.1 hypothetical protein [Nanoarchaeota archaeon]MBU2441347.1 hypothetical protein [Nanoarchaeota archaeon]